MKENITGNSGQESARVLIVDNDAAVREALSLLVSSCGWSSGHYPSAMDFLHEYRPEGRDCLVVDIHMPGMTGAELVETLRQRDILVPVIVITATPEDPLAGRTLDAGARVVLGKPVEEEVFLKEIRVALRLPLH